MPFWCVHCADICNPSENIICMCRLVNQHSYFTTSWRDVLSTCRLSIFGKEICRRGKRAVIVNYPKDIYCAIRWSWGFDPPCGWGVLRLQNPLCNAFFSIKWEPQSSAKCTMVHFWSSLLKGDGMIVLPRWKYKWKRYWSSLKNITYMTW